MASVSDRQHGRNDWIGGRDFTDTLAMAGLLAFALLLPIENSLRVPIFGSLGRISGALMVVLAAPTFFRGRGFAFRAPSVTLLLLGAYALWGASSILWTHSLANSITYASTVLQLLVLSIVVWHLCRSARRRNAVQQAYVFGAVLAVVSAFWNYLNGAEVVFGRYAAAGTDPNDFALIVVLAVPMAWDIAAKSTSRRATLNYLMIPIALGAVILSGSRGGLIAFLVSLLVIPFGWRGLDEAKRRLLRFAGALVFVAIPFLVQSVVSSATRNLDRLLGTATDALAGSLNLRDVIWGFAFRIFSDYPITGVGGGAFPYALEERSGMAERAHNMLLSVSVELGLIGLLLFLGVIISAAFPLLFRRNDGTYTSAILLATLLIGTLPLTWETRKQTWMVIMLAATHVPVLVGPRRVPRTASSISKPWAPVLRREA